MKYFKKFLFYPALFCVYTWHTCVFSAKFREDIRDADNSEHGWRFVTRLGESKDEERKRLLELRLLEERNLANSRRGRGGGNGGRGRGGGQGQAAPRNAGGQNDDANIICSWCQTAG